MLATNEERYNTLYRADYQSFKPYD